ncbi:polysaccharide deacetylase family protein [Alkaliphilus pronyensis]|uniref:Polysaccharide deacetylase family protein n=1 Tax=Alkaliphilus pronyensis TaxID=1482732 RepID=A0A6I0F6D3_9FIRM|nr:polysaccharide deacetylase family protein [Alkaliphilus pronyensis]KAB3531023.1 polysaccharide deacetylase family protein [Alkaliphilus pronyensis]
MKKNIVIVLLLIIIILLLTSIDIKGFQKIDDVQLPTYDVNINGVKVDNTYSEYPLLNYKDITYLPMTENYVKDLGLEISWDKEKGLSITELDKYKENEASKLPHEVDSIIDAKIPIITYHHIHTDPSVWSDITISPQKFREDMLYLKALNYNPIHFKDYFSAVDNGSSLPDNPIIITFDDGYRSNYLLAYPILKELNMKATITVIGWSVGRELHKDGQTPIKPHFTWEEAKEMYDSGLIDIQHHTYDLHNLGDGVTCGLGVSQMSDESREDYIKRLRNDTVKLKKLIEEKIGNEVNVFSYPYGVFNEISEEVIKQLGFKATLTTIDDVWNLEDGHYQLERINMPSGVKSIDLMKRILVLDDREVNIPFENIENQMERIEKLENLVIK